MSRDFLKVFPVYGFALLLVFLGACGGSDVAGDGPLVTVSGIVLSIDDGACAEGTVVYLLDNDNKYTTTKATGSDCKFSIKVPGNSRFLLATDDFASAKRGITGDWFPLVNIDSFHTPKITKSLTNIIIHACPQSKGKAKGSVAAWEDYLANDDAGNGNLFVPTSTDDATIVAGVFLGVDSTVFSLLPNMQVTSDDSSYKIAYGENIFDGNGVPDPTLKPAYFPGTRTKTNGTGFITSFVNSTSGEISLTVTDKDSSRNLDFNSPVSVPVRKHMISLLLPGEIDGVANKAPCQVFFAAGFAPTNCTN